MPSYRTMELPKNEINGLKRAHVETVEYVLVFIKIKWDFLVFGK